MILQDFFKLIYYVLNKTFVRIRKLRQLTMMQLVLKYLSLCSLLNVIPDLTCTRLTNFIQLDLNKLYTINHPTSRKITKSHQTSLYTSQPQKIKSPTLPKPHQASLYISQHYPNKSPNLTKNHKTSSNLSHYFPPSP